MTLAAQLDVAVSAVCPINGVSIGSRNDKSTWSIDFKDGATIEQRKAARAVIDAFDMNVVEQSQKILTDGALATVLISKGILRQQDIDALL